MVKVCGMILMISVIEESLSDLVGMIEMRGRVVLFTVEEAMSGRRVNECGDLDRLAGGWIWSLCRSEGRLRMVASS